MSLSSKSGLKRLNALDIGKQMKKIFQFYPEGFDFDEYSSFLLPHINKVGETTIEKEAHLEVLKEIFNLFDEDESGTVSPKEMANCMSVLCGGTIENKI